MNNQKDTENTSINSYGHKDVTSMNTLASKPVSKGGPSYDLTNKKTEKLVTALYMVTDCMDSDDALKSKLRSLGVELLSDMHKFSMLSPQDKSVRISLSLSHIHELLSFVGIARTMGFISEMNSSILNREFMSLTVELESYKSKENHFTFTLDDSMFEMGAIPENTLLAKDTLKDTSTYHGHSLKRTYSTHTNIKKVEASHSKGPTNNAHNPIDKDGRMKKILSLIKDVDTTRSGVSIKDISSAFTDCSEKTIQRELNSLVAKGSLKKIGAKRWSKYQTI